MYVYMLLLNTYIKKSSQPLILSSFSKLTSGDSTKKSRWSKDDNVYPNVMRDLC